MDEILEQSCPICLRADELPSMVPVDIPHALLMNQRHIVICRSCAFAIADWIDEEHFEMRLHASAIQALQQRVNQLEAAVRELRTEAFGDRAGDVLQRNTAPEVPALRSAHARSRARAHGPGLA